MATMNAKDPSFFTLNRPLSVAIYDTADDAQRAVDYLADNRFPVQNLAIVGTDLKQVERVTGELTWGRVIGSGAMSGVSLGLLYALFLYFFAPNLGVAAFLMGLALGVVTGMITASISYGATKGRKDYSSLSQIVATHYEILGEAEVAGEARRLLSAGRVDAPVRDLPVGPGGPIPAQPGQSASYPPPQWEPPQAPPATAQQWPAPQPARAAPELTPLPAPELPPAAPASPPAATEPVEFDPRPQPGQSATDRQSPQS